MFIIGMTTDQWVNVALVVVPLVIGWVLRTKAKADKAEQKNEMNVIEKKLTDYVDSKIKDELQPMESRIEAHEKRIEKEISTIKEIVSSIQIAQQVSSQRTEDIFNILKSQADSTEKTFTRIEKLFEKNDSYIRKQLEKLWQNKADKNS